MIRSNNHSPKGENPKEKTIDSNIAYSSYKRGTIAGSKYSKLSMSPIMPRGEVSPLLKSQDMNKGISPLILDEIQTKFIVRSSFKSKAGNKDGVPKTNQDSTLMKLSGLKRNGFNLYGIMDGHGSHGHFISNSVKSYFTDFIFNSSLYEESPSLTSILKKLQEKDYHYIKQCFQNCESSLAKSRYEVNFSGTTAVMVIQIDDILICANTGDSRAILFSNQGVKNLSNDHKPDNESEMLRIVNSGGRVEKYKDDNEYVGPYRVWLKYDDYPGLAMSRSLGDFVAKSVGCSCIPEIIEMKITDRTYFMIIASDGVWEFLNNMTVSKIVEPFYYRKDPEGASIKLVEESAKAWKRVNQI